MSIRIQIYRGAVNQNLSYLQKDLFFVDTLLLKDMVFHDDTAITSADIPALQRLGVLCSTPLFLFVL